MFSRIGSAAVKKDLHNIKRLCDELGNPEHEVKYIHVGGTNGKGSVSHMLAATLQTAGYKTGLYTSPHLYDFRERIKINGEMISEDFVIAFTEKIKPLIEEIQPSFFEISLAMAFVAFADANVDVSVIEVGLGGRLDSTNIIHPELSVITNIGWDHMNMLGNTLAEIAIEKAGIIKENVPVVIGERQNETDDVFIKTATEKKAPIYFASERFSVHEFQMAVDKLEVIVKNSKNNTTIDLQPDLNGIYQLKNVCTVLQCIEVLNEKGWKIDEATVEKALGQTKSLTGLHGRWEVLSSKPAVVLEVAHNPDGIIEMNKHISGLKFEQLHIIFGTVKDKDVAAVLRLLPANAFYYFTQADIPRALDAVQLAAMGEEYGLKGDVFVDVNAAVQEAVSKAGEDDLIVVCGSIFLVAEVDKTLFKNIKHAYN
jgi:dihydrofolate synthase / folylpolyglutamate synthase